MSDASEGHTRPLLFGYMRREFLVTDGRVETVRRELEAFARAEGFAMGFTFVEQLGRSPAAFAALVEAVIHYEVPAVVLPSLLHFAGLGAPIKIRNSFELVTGTRVLTAQAGTPRPAGAV